jgi:hypothetical protein
MQRPALTNDTVVPDSAQYKVAAESIEYATGSKLEDVALTV